MKKLLTLALLTSVSLQAYAMPDITGRQIQIDEPTLVHAKGKAQAEPSISGYVNEINDLNAEINRCDLVFSTPGNYNAVLTEYMYNNFLPKNKHLAMKGNVFWTTSKPIAKAQINSGQIVIGNFRSTCRPNVAAGPKRVVDELVADGLAVGVPIAFSKSQGNMLLVKKGNPHNVREIADIAGLKFATSKNAQDGKPGELGSFGNYARTVFNVSEFLYGTVKATKIFNTVYNNDSLNGGQPNYVSWGPIMHRGVPELIASGQADVGMCFYHLCLQWQREHPELFDIIPLGGTVENPEPYPGNPQGTLFIVEVAGNSHKQHHIAKSLIAGFQSQVFTDLLLKHGLLRP